MKIQAACAPVLLVGASGFLGSHVASRLSSDGAAVVGLGPQEPKGVQFERFHVGRSTSSDLFVEAATGCSTVIYLGGGSRPGVGWTTMSDEVTKEAGHVIDLAEIGASLSIKHFVFASSGGTVYGAANEVFNESSATRPLNNYGLAKLVAEESLLCMARRGDLDVSILRIANPYGPRQIVKGKQGFIAAACQAAISGETLPIWGDGSTTRDFVYVDDVADAFAKLLQSSPTNAVLNISSGRGISLVEICRVIEGKLGRKILTAFEPARVVDAPVVVLSNDAAARQLNWVPITTLEDGIEKTLKWWESWLRESSTGA